MKIAILIEDVNKSAGQERVIAELVARLVKRHEVHLFCFEARDIPPQVIVHRLRRPPLRFFMVRALWMVLAGRLAVHPRAYDVVLSQGGNALNQTHTLVHTCLAKRWELTRRVYWRLRPPSLSERVIRSLWFKLVVTLERRAVRRCRNGRTLAVSHELAEVLSREHGVPREGIIACENGVDHERFRPDPQDPARARLRAAMGLQEDDLLALFLGGRWIEKGASYAVEALTHVNPRVHLCLAGRDRPEPFVAQATRLGVADRLHILPATERAWEYYHAADAFVLPGHEEGFGLVAVEAAACGLPVLMTPVGVAERLIEDGVSGFLIAQDPREIAQRLDWLAADAGRRRQMGRAANTSSLKFSWDRQASEIEAALQQARS